MAQMLARMERDGLIERAPDPADGRKSRITLTAAARSRLPEALAVLFEGNREALRGFTAEETALLAALLTRLIANLDRIAGGAGPAARQSRRTATDRTAAVAAGAAPAIPVFVTARTAPPPSRPGRVRRRRWRR